MKQRIISGTILTVLAIAALLLGDWVLAAAVLFLSVCAFRELCHAAGAHTEGKRINGLEMAGYAAILIYDAIMYDGTGSLFAIELLPLVIIAGIMLMMAVYVLSFPKFKAAQVMAAGFSLLYGPVMLSFIYLTRALPHGIYYVWMIFISSWVCDTCAYFTGVTLGKHKLAPVLSPKKSVEGSVGGVAGSAAVGAIYAFFLVKYGLLDQRMIGILALVGAAGAVISQIGDLAASGIKRDHNIKDYGKLIPGHGGIMDRFDSVIFTGPATYLLLRLFL